VTARKFDAILTGDMVWTSRRWGPCVRTLIQALERVAALRVIVVHRNARGVGRTKETQDQNCRPTPSIRLLGVASDSTSRARGIPTTVRRRL